VSVVTGAWVDVFRNLPLLLLILFLFLWIPQSARNTWEGAIPGWAPEAWQSGLMLAGLSGLVLYNSAVLAEIVRAGILAIPRGEVEASRSLGLGYAQTMRHVVLPQAFARMTPALVSQLITLIKDTSLGSIIAAFELVGHARAFINTNNNLVETMFVVAVIFFLLNFPLSLLSRRLEARQPAAERVRVTGEEDQVTAVPAGGGPRTP
jgi:ABC-type amino acid transport system permease subunit